MREKLTPNCAKVLAFLCTGGYDFGCFPFAPIMEATESDREGFFIVDELGCEARPFRYSSFAHARAALHNIIQTEMVMADVEESAS